jgi:hypothetical protein
MDPAYSEHANFGTIPVFHQIFMKSPSVSYEHNLHSADKTTSVQLSDHTSSSVSRVHPKKLKITYFAS